jgi:hypothetical protein
MVHNIEEREAMENRDPFIAGYFTQRVQSGERPKYGYPANHLPETTGARMEVCTSFMVCENSKNSFRRL